MASRVLYATGCETYVSLFFLIFDLKRVVYAYMADPGNEHACDNIRVEAYGGLILEHL